MPSSPASFTFRVLGTPVPQGSVKAYGSRVVANNEHALGSWRSDVAAVAHREKPADWDITAAVSLRCELCVSSPAVALRHRRERHKVKSLIS